MSRARTKSRFDSFIFKLANRAWQNWTTQDSNHFVVTEDNVNDSGELSQTSVASAARGAATQAVVCQFDARLTAVMEAWESLPEFIRDEIVRLAESGQC